MGLSEKFDFGKGRAFLLEVLGWWNALMNKLDGSGEWIVSDLKDSLSVVQSGPFIIMAAKGIHCSAKNIIKTEKTN